MRDCGKIISPESYICFPALEVLLHVLSPTDRLTSMAKDPFAVVPPLSSFPFFLVDFSHLMAALLAVEALMVMSNSMNIS